jgi:hypothetical protein
MNAEVHNGGCFCGAVRYAVMGNASFLCFCHCTSCRRAAGATPVAWGTFKLSDFRVSHGHLGKMVTSPGVTRGHCEQCGTSLTYQHEKRAADIDVTLATFDDTAGLRPTAHIWVEDRLPWVQIGDGLPQYSKGITGA